MDEFYFFEKNGQITEWPGIELSIKKKETNELIGKIFLLDIDPMYEYDKKIEIILNDIEDYNSYNFLKETTTIFQYSLKIEENFRNKGYATLIKKEVENITKQYYYSYTAAVTNIKNEYSQRINRKLGYQILHRFHGYDFFFKKI
jgi:RimJ/RimL family protein N-acetyltransferase